MRPFNKTKATLVTTHPFSTLCPTPLGNSPVCGIESYTDTHQLTESRMITWQNDALLICHLLLLTLPKYLYILYPPLGHSIDWNLQLSQYWIPIHLTMPAIFYHWCSSLLQLQKMTNSFHNFTCINNWLNWFLANYYCPECQHAVDLAVVWMSHSAGSLSRHWAGAGAGELTGSWRKNWAEWHQPR